MKTLFKILRSIATSLLFLLLIIVITLQFTFLVINSNTRKIKNLIDPELVLQDVAGPDLILNDNIKSVSLQFINGYIDYIFSKRSYPSIQTIDTNKLSEEDKTLAENILKELQRRIDLDYKTIVEIRNLSNFITNGSLHLLVDISVLFVFLVLTINVFSFKKSIRLLGLSLSIAGGISFLMSTIAFSKISKIANPILKSFGKSIFNTRIRSSIFRMSMIYIVIGIIITLSIYLIDKYNNRRQIQTI